MAIFTPAETGWRLTDAGNRMAEAGIDAILATSYPAYC